MRYTRATQAAPASTHTPPSINKQALAALALSYSAAEWRISLRIRLILDILIVTCLLLLLLLLHHMRQKHITLSQKANKLAFQETLYRSVFEQAPIGIALIDNKTNSPATFSSINPAGEAIIGRAAQELKKISWAALSHPDDLNKERAQFERFAKSEIASYSVEKRLLKPDGSISWISLTLVGFAGDSFSDSTYLCLIEDISARKLSEETLKESERSKSVFLSHLPGMAYRCQNDQHWTMEFVSEGCLALTGYRPESLIGNRIISYSHIIAPEYRRAVAAGWQSILAEQTRYHGEYEIITKSGQRKWVLELGQGIYNSQGRVEALEGIVLDITEQKQRESQITYLEQRDPLTGLYNRSYMEQEKQRLDRPRFLPLSLIICDIDGLRVVNDAYGHAQGDRLIIKTAGLIQSCLGAGHILGHSGGGEFVVLLPSTDGPTALQLTSDIKNKVAAYNENNKDSLYTVSVSIGLGTKERPDQALTAVYKAAEEYLSSRKILNQNSSHSAILSSIMATLYAKSQETEQHGQRLGIFCRMLGEQLGLAQKDLDDLQLVAQLHDIGKIGIDNQILNKPGKLTAAEWEEIKKHPAIGHRIASSSPQLEHIADYILHHHERWDGTGYPMGLKEEEIPLVSRILTIADAFDAMTEDRIYRKAMSRQEALQEIKQNAGSQFDPRLAQVFVEIMGNN